MIKREVLKVTRLQVTKPTQKNDKMRKSSGKAMTSKENLELQ